MVVFIGMVAAVALYCARRPTVARGAVVGAQLVETNPLVESMDCQDEIPIGLTGATFACTARFRGGGEAHYTLRMDREGKIETVAHGKAEVAPRIKKTSDPWGD